MRSTRITPWTELPAMLGLLLIFVLIGALLGMSDAIDTAVIDTAVLGWR